MTGAVRRILPCRCHILDTTGAVYRRDTAAGLPSAACSPDVSMRICVVDARRLFAHVTGKDYLMVKAVFVLRLRWLGFGGFAWDSMAAISPSTEVDQPAAFTTEWPPAFFCHPAHRLAAGRTFDYSLTHNAQQVRRKEMSSPACFGRSLGSGCRKRMAKRCLPPLTSA